MIERHGQVESIELGDDDIADLVSSDVREIPAQIGRAGDREGAVQKSGGVAERVKLILEAGADSCHGEGGGAVRVDGDLVQMGRPIVALLPITNGSRHVNSKFRF
jgi:hypothetical protein